MRKIILSILLVAITYTSWAQRTDIGSELEVDYSFKISKGLHANFGEEVRFKQNSSRYSKSETSVGLEYDLLRKLLKAHDTKIRLCGSYSFINRLNSSLLYENQSRVYLGLSASKRLGNWQIGVRTRWQSTWRDQRRGHYALNPQTYLRSKVKISYKPNESSWDWYVGEEVFNRINQPGNNIIDEFRTTLGVTHKINKHNEIDLFLKASQEVQVNNPETFFSLGAAWMID